MRHHALLYVTLLAVFLMACSEEHEHVAPAIYPRDSVSVMISNGVNTLISDSGVVKYRIVAEQWEVNQNKKPSRWIFEKGLFLEQFDLAMHVQSFIQCDTAYYYDTDRLWELRGRVRIHTKNGVKFSSEELFWDERVKEFYSNKFSHVITPDKELKGNRFRSDDKMNKYSVKYTNGYFDRNDFANSPRSNMTKTQADSAKMQGRGQASPRRINKNN
ncbi:MAG: LPS export ABC transporter periplasmic protein LptC [Prevotella sp.]|nr:LPS export ABC transporter periplasmic protein LptC [Prevotella sp.]